MKRNLSSQAIRAMAIGMAVTLGSATAVSGVVTGTVVNVYAAAFNTVQFTAKATKSGSDLKITITRDGSNVFKADDNTKKLTGLVVKNNNKVVFSNDEGGNLDQVTSDAKSNANELVITIPNAQIKSESLDGTETELKITKLKSTDIKYGTSNSEQPLNFDAGELSITADAAIGIDKTAPTIKGAIVEKTEPSKVKVTFSENVKGDSLTAGDFKVLVGVSGDQDNVVTNIEGIETSANTKVATLTLTKPVTDADIVKLYYQKTGNAIKDSADNEFANIAEGSKIDVTNELKDTIAPTIQSGVIENDKPNEVVLTFSENINVVANQPDATDFKVLTGANSNIDTNTVTKLSNIDGSGKTLTLTLKDNITSTDVVKVYYTKGNNVIQDAANNHFLSIDKQDAIEVTNNIKSPVSNELTATTDIGTYKFKELNDTTVALTEFTVVVSRNAKNNIFENGILKANGKTYTLTEIGDGTKAVGGLTNAALEGHTTNVTEIKAKAFENNTEVKILSFPKVTTVGADAFKGANSLTTIDLGSKVDTKVKIDINAFTGATKIANVTTNEVSKADVEAAAKKGNNDVKVDVPVSIPEDKYNVVDAKISKDSFYQTKDGLIFKGLSDTELSFEGKGIFNAPTKPNALDGRTKETAYLVTYAKGVVSLKPGKVEENFDVTVQGKRLTFKPLDDSSVALTSVGDTSLFRAAATDNTLENGVLDVNGKKYNFTQIGDGTNSLGADFEANKVLKGNLDKVNTVAKDAFKGNTTLTEISLPNVTTIAEGAFKGTSNLAKVFLGDKVVTVASGAFENTKSDIKVSSNNNTTLNNLKNPGTGLDDSKVENAAPFVTSAVVNKGAANKVVVKFSEKVYAPVAITASDFKIEGDGSKLTVNSVEGLQTGKDQTKDTITLTLSGDVKAGEARTLKYTKSSNAIKDINDIEFKDITEGIKITNNLEASVDLPTVQTATVESGAKADIVLTLDKEPTTQLVDVDKNDFKVAVANGKTKDHKVKTVKTSGNKVTITLDKDLASDNTDIKLTYTGNKIKALNNQVVTNNIQPQTVDVKVDSVTVDGVTLKITVNNGKTLKDEPTLGKDSFNVTKGTANTTVDVSSAAVASNVITLTLGAAIEAGDTEIKVEYNGKNTKLVENGTNAPIGSIASQFAVNEKDVTAPTLPDKASVTATTTSPKTGITITLPVSEPIKAKQVNIPVGKFTVTVVGGVKNITVNSVKIGADKKSLVLECTSDNALAESTDKLKVVYTASDEITDLKGNQLEAKTLDDITISAARTAAIVSSSDSDLVAIAPVQVINQNGDVTSITSVKGANAIEINSILTDKLTKINNGAFKDVVQDLELDFSKVNVSNLNIESEAFSGAKGLNITGVNSSDTEKLAKMIGSSSDIKINGKTTQDIIKDNSNSGNGGSGSGGGSSSGGSSSGGSGGGSGANIGTITNKKPNTEETTSQVNNNNETVVENKQLSFDVIKLPSVEGEAKVFGDVSANHWAKSYIDKLSTARIINGSNGMFNPNGQTKRADVTVMLVNLLGLTPEANNKFADVNTMHLM